MRRIAIWNTAFLGDAVLTLPLMQSLALRYPQAELDFYVRGGLAPLFTAHPALRDVYAFDKRGKHKTLSGMRGFAREAASRKYDLWISAHTSLRSSLMARASGAPVRIGYSAARGGRLCYTRLVDRRFDEREEIERLLALLEPLGDGPVSFWPEIVLPPQARARAATFFDALSGPGLGLHPGSVWATKRWPAGYFADIGRRALDAGVDVLLFAGPGEESIAAEVKYRMMEQGAGRGRLHDFSGRLTIPELAAFLARLHCYVTNDSGPMHLAWAQHTPVTAVFGPTVRSLGFFPRGETTTVFEAQEPCRPCSLHGPANCPLGHHRCMVEVRPELVWPDVERKLSMPRSAVLDAAKKE